MSDVPWWGYVVVFLAFAVPGIVILILEDYYYHKWHIGDRKPYPHPQRREGGAVSEKKCQAARFINGNTSILAICLRPAVVEVNGKLFCEKHSPENEP